MFTVAYSPDCRLRKFVLISCMLKLLEDEQEYKACQEVAHIVNLRRLLSKKIPSPWSWSHQGRQVSQLVVLLFDLTPRG